MRVMDVPPFPSEIEIHDLDNLLRTRLSGKLVMWPNQAIPLLGYMCHPADKAARETLTRILRGWNDHSASGQPPVPGKLGRIQADWLKVADIFHLYCDLPFARPTFDAFAPRWRERQPNSVHREAPCAHHEHAFERSQI